MRWYLVFFILCCSFAYAVDVEFTQDDYAPFETVLVKINFTEDIVGSLMPVNVNVDGINIAGKKVVKIDDIYYVYFYLPFVEKGTYKFELNDIMVHDGDLTKQNFDKSFNVVERNSISLRPGLIYLDLGSSDKPQLGFDITNKGNLLDFGLTVDGQFLVLDKKSFKLNPGNQKRVDVQTNFNELNETVLLGSFNANYGGFVYKVPVIVKRDIPIANIVEENETVLEPVVEVIKIPENALVFDIIKNSGNKIDLVLSEDESKAGEMYFRNDYTSNLENVSFELKGLNEVINYRYLGDTILKPDEVESVTLNINPNKNLSKDYEGSLIVTASGLKAELPISIKLRKEEIKPIVNETNKESVIYSATEKTSKVWIVFVVLGLFIIVFFVMYFKGRRDRKDFNHFVSQISGK